MTDEKKMFSSYEKNKDFQDAITFGDGSQGKIKGLGMLPPPSTLFPMYSW
jgi:hypothetical protein